MPDGNYGGWDEELANAGFTEEGEQLLFELGLIQFRSVDPEKSGYDSLEVVELTPLGRKLLTEATKSND